MPSAAAPSPALIEIKDRYAGTVIWSGAVATVRDAVLECYRAGVPLCYADLTGAYLKGADLTGADLKGAYLTGAYLKGADLTGADLTGAYLKGADLKGAYLKGADLKGAYLTGADLKGAYLTGADLKGAYLTGGETFEQYLAEVVPALLTAAGKTIAEIIAAGAWECHEWSNCPMAIAFDIRDPEQGPALLRPRIREFVQLFDAGLIPKPEVAAMAVQS